MPQEKSYALIGLIADLGQLREENRLVVRSPCNQTHLTLLCYPCRQTLCDETLLPKNTVKGLKIALCLLRFMCILTSWHLSSPDLPHTEQRVHMHLSQPSPCAHIYTHTDAKMHQFHILFQDAKDAVSHDSVWSDLMQLCKWSIVF